MKLEANHLEDVAILCKYCDKTFRSKNALRQTQEITLKWIYFNSMFQLKIQIIFCMFPFSIWDSSENLFWTFVFFSDVTVSLGLYWTIHLLFYHQNIVKIVIRVHHLLIIFVVNIRKRSLLWTPLHLRTLIIKYCHIVNNCPHYQHLVTSPRHQGINNIHRVVARPLQYKPGT